MIPASFQNVAGQGMALQGAQAQPVQQRMNPQITQRIFQALQSLQPPQNLQGWQMGFQEPQRVHVVFQLFVLTPPTKRTDTDRGKGLVTTTDQERDEH